MIAIGTIAAYNLAVIFLFANWKKIKPITHIAQNNFYFSVIIAAKNETDNIDALATSLQSQSFDNARFEIIFVNDHSTDNTKTVLTPYVSDERNFFLIDNKGVGKKAAINTGIDYSFFAHTFIINQKKIALIGHVRRKYSFGIVG